MISLLILWSIGLLILVFILPYQPKSNSENQPQTGETASRPNITFFFTDDQGHGTQKDFGYQDVKTPNLDVLIEKGVGFKRHYGYEEYGTLFNRKKLN